MNEKENGEKLVKEFGLFDYIDKPLFARVVFKRPAIITTTVTYTIEY